MHIGSDTVANAIKVVSTILDTPDTASFVLEETYNAMS